MKLQINKNALLNTLITAAILIASMIFISPVFASFTTAFDFLIKFVSGCFIMSGIINLYKHFSR